MISSLRFSKVEGMKKGYFVSVDERDFPRHLWSLSEKRVFYAAQTVKLRSLSEKRVLVAP